MRLLCGCLMLDGSTPGREAFAARVRALAACGERSPVAPRHELWSEGPISLSVLDFDPAAHESPRGPLIARSASGAVLAADVRLDEPAALAAELGLEENGPSVPLQQADTRLTAAAFDKFGNAAPERLLGDFALAHWSPGSRHLRLARDTAGVRPLVYHLAPARHLLFASFPAALRAAAPGHFPFAEAALAHALLRRFVPEETLWEGIQALPAGHTLHLTVGGEPKVAPYWRPRLQPCRHRTPAAATEELRDLLTRAVAGRVRGTGPVAAHLSGGLDSSSIAVLAARELGRANRSLLAYSFLDEEATPSAGASTETEAPFVAAVLAQQPEIRWQAIPPSPTGDWLYGATDADRALPLAESSPEIAVCAHARRGGAQLVLSGWGGDEGVTFNGRGALADAFLHGRWKYLAAELGALKGQRGFRRRHTLSHDVAGLLVPRFLDNRLRRLLGRDTTARPDALRFLQPALRQRFAGVTGSELETGPHLRRNQLRLLASAHIVARTTDWAAVGARFGQAFAFPLLDRRLVDFALSVPATWHIRGGWKRRLFRDATEGILPPLIQWRHTKLMPFGYAFAQAVGERAVFLSRLHSLGTHPLVRQLFDLPAMRSEVEAWSDGADAEFAQLFRFSQLCQAMSYAAFVQTNVQADA